MLLYAFNVITLLNIIWLMAGLRALNWCVLPVLPRILKGKSLLHRFLCLERNRFLEDFTESLTTCSNVGACTQTCRNGCATITPQELSKTWQDLNLWLGTWIKFPFVRFRIPQIVFGSRYMTAMGNRCPQRESNPPPLLLWFQHHSSVLTRLLRPFEIGVDRGCCPLLVGFTGQDTATIRIPPWKCCSEGYIEYVYSPKER